MAKRCLAKECAALRWPAAGRWRQCPHTLSAFRFPLAFRQAVNHIAQLLLAALVGLAALRGLEKFVYIWIVIHILRVLILSFNDCIAREIVV